MYIACISLYNYFARNILILSYLILKSENYVLRIKSEPLWLLEWDLEGHSFHVFVVVGKIRIFNEKDRPGDIAQVQPHQAEPLWESETTFTELQSLKVFHSISGNLEKSPKFVTLEI